MHIDSQMVGHDTHTSSSWDVRLETEQIAPCKVQFQNMN